MRPAVLFVLVVVLAGRGDARAQPEAGPSARVALVPLDDRPANLQLPARLGAVADASVVTPRREDLGRFTLAGRPEAVAGWLNALDLDELDAAILSVDMLAFGGLLASRVAGTSETEARRHLDAITHLKQRRAELPVYAFTTVMRRAPTGDSRNDAWREALARWAEIAPTATANPEAAQEMTELERIIPAAALANYRAARARHRAINLATLDLVAAGSVDLLIVGLDDVGTRGLDVEDALALGAAVTARGLDDRVVFLPGADQLGMVLMARALVDRFEFTPEVRVTYSSDAERGSRMPFEDRELERTVAGHISAVGARHPGTDAAGKTTPLQLFVYASRREDDANLEFADLVAAAAAKGPPVIVADVDTTGIEQGASLPLVEALRGHRALPGLFAYASWNTAGNTIGTALAHGSVAALAVDRIAGTSPEAALRVSAAHLRFLLGRLVDDFLYRAIVRADVNDTFVSERRWNPNRLDPAERRRLETYIRGELAPLAESLVADFAGWTLRASDGRAIAELGVPAIDRFDVRLPWGRTFELEIDLDLSVEPAALEKK